MSVVERLYLLLIVSLPIVRPFSFRVSGMAVQVSDLIFVAATLAWLAGIAGGRCKLVWNGFFALLLTYLGALGLSVWLSDHEQASALKLLGTAYLAGLSVLTVNLVRSWSFLRGVLLAWLAGTAITVACGVFAVVLFYAGLTGPAAFFGLTHYGSLPPGDYPRGQALFSNMNMLCNYLIPSAMIALVAKRLGWLSTIWARLLLAGTWLTAIFTVSVGIGGLLLAASEWRWLRGALGGGLRPFDRLLRAAAIVLALVLLAAAIVVPAATGAPRGTTSVRAATVGGIELEWAPRALVWRLALETFLEHPWVGQGPGTPVASHRFVARSGTVQHLTDAHNLWLSIAAQGGLLALVAFSVLLGYLARLVLPLSTGDGRRAITLGGLWLALAGALLYHGLTGSFEDARHLWVLMGLIVTVGERLSSEPGPVQVLSN